MCKLTLYRVYYITIDFVKWSEVDSHTHTHILDLAICPTFTSLFLYSLVYFLLKGENGSNKKIYQLMYILAQASSIYLSMLHPIDCGSISCTHSYCYFYQSAYSLPAPLRQSYLCMSSLGQVQFISPCHGFQSIL